MSPGRFRWEGLSFAAAGIAFVAKAFFDFKAGKPPADGARLLGWVSDEKFALSMSDELLVIASVLMTPGLVGLYRSLRGAPRRGATAGSAILAATIPVLITVSVFGGRLVFPVYDIKITDPDTAKLTAALYFGGQHAALLILGVAIFALSLALQGIPKGRKVGLLGLVTAIATIAGSYPDVIGVRLTLLTAVLLGAWFVAVGAHLSRNIAPNAARSER